VAAGQAFLTAMLTTGEAACGGELVGGGGGCDMMVQPFVPSVGTEGELSVITVGGAVTHAVVKTPAPGDFRTQEEHGGVPAGVPVTPEVRALATQVLAAAHASCAAWVAAGGAGLDGGGGAADAGGPLPADAILYGRLDFLRLPAEGGEVGRWALLELEVIEPCLFFGCAPCVPATPGRTGNVAADALVDAVERLLDG
jgi:hypothetical protein